MRKKLKNSKGFTLIELLVAMTISGVVVSSVYWVYSSQQESYITQEQVAEMQENIRSALFYMESEIRMAGCDPTRDAGAGIVTAGLLVYLTYAMLRPEKF